MNVGQMYELRKKMDKICELCDTIEGTGLWPAAGRIRFKEAFRLDLARFCMYLCASDGKVSGGEVLFFKIALGFDSSIDEIIRIIKEEGLYSENFEKKVPLTISVLKDIEDNLVAKGINIKGQTEQFIQFYYEVGCGLIQADDDLADNELRDLNIYMNTLYDFAGVVNRTVAERRSGGSSNYNGDSAVPKSGPILPNLDFPTIKVNGFGNRVITDVELPSIAMLVTARHTMGTSNFWAHYYDGDGNKSTAIINEIGKYSGTILFNNSKAESGSGILEVEADGKWSLEFMAIPRAIKLGGSSNVRGKGCVATDMFEGNGKPNVIKCKHDGTSNFVVRIISDEGDNKLLINEIGYFSGQKVCKLEKGIRYFMLIQADGSWSVDFGLGDSEVYCGLKEGF